MANDNYDEQTKEPISVDTMKETDKKCPACGGVMDFNPATGGLKCPFCDHEEAIEAEDELFVAEELDFFAADDMASSDWGTQTKSVICKSCGAETIYDSHQISNECPYCGSNQVMDVADDNVMRPNGVVLFKVNQEKAAESFSNWINGKIFCPTAAKRSAKPKSFNGMYLPYWTFDAETMSSYRAEYGIDKHYKDKEGNTKTETTWYTTSGTYDEDFDDLLHCASKNQTSSMLNSIEPYDTSDVVEYKSEYMAGFSAEKYTIAMKEAWPDVERRIYSTLQSNIRSYILDHRNADRVRNLNFETEYDKITYKYLLLPLWISSFKFENKIYRFMVNGQTGKVSGDAPVSKLRVAIAVIIAIAIIVGLYYAFYK